MQTQSLHSAIIGHYVAKKAEAIAMIELIYNNSTAIGDHTNILDELKKWVGILEKSESCINTLNGLFKEREANNAE
jgi:hypothetical protein|tara:strand:+ start:128 stop:355 length:228 start_codon:yes stop_codon:yes gene_type:complete